MVERVIIVGAGGRDFHNFNVYFKGNPRYKVIAFTAAQIPHIEKRLYPPELAGDLYRDGIPVYPESMLAELIREHRIDLVAFSYSDVSHVEVMHKASLVMAEGADFMLLGATYTMLRSARPVIAVCAVRTGCGKSQTTREVCRILRGRGRKVVAVRHPMPYGDLKRQAVQRFCSLEDVRLNECTIEEREEYEPLIEMGIVVYAGVDYEGIVRCAEKESEVIVWDGGNNDTPFYHPDVHIVVFDPHRPGHELLYYPGETNMIMADVAVINKIDSAPESGVETVKANIREFASRADIVLAESPITVDAPEQIRGKRVLVVEDGPTLTHGGMRFGAGTIAANRYEVSEIVDARRHAVGSILDAYARYPHLGAELPAMGYGEEQMKDLEETINAADCDVVMFATPINLTSLLSIDKPAVRVRYEYGDHGSPTLEEVLLKRMEALRIA